VGLWSVGKQTLVLGTNLNYNEATFSLKEVTGAVSGVVSGLVNVERVQQVFDSGAKVVGGEVIFESVGSGGFIVG